MISSNDDSISSLASSFPRQQGHCRQSTDTPSRSRQDLEMTMNDLASLSCMSSSKEDLSSSFIPDQDLMISTPFTARRRQKQQNQQQQRQLLRELIHKQNQQSPCYVPSDDDVSLFDCELPPEVDSSPLPFPPVSPTPQRSTTTMTVSSDSVSSISLGSTILSPSSGGSLMSVSFSSMLDVQESPPTMARLQMKKLKTKKKSKSKKKKKTRLIGDDDGDDPANNTGVKVVGNTPRKSSASCVSVSSRQSASSSSSSSTTMSRS